MLGPFAKHLEKKLKSELNVLELTIKDQTERHANHGWSKDGETHFSIKIVSDDFKGKKHIDRQKMVYSILEEELSSGRLHALSLRTLTSTEGGKAQKPF